MASFTFWLALLSPCSLALGWFLLSFPPLWTIGNAPALALLALAPVAFFASALLGVQQVLRGDRRGSGWLAAGLVVDYCWFHAVLAFFIVAQVGRPG